MSLETRSSTQEAVIWGGSVRWDEATQTQSDVIEVGRYEFDRTDFFIGILEFLGGEKQFTVGSVNVNIPDTPLGEVKFGEIELPYGEYVHGVMWTMNQTGRILEEWEATRSMMTAVATDALHDQLKRKVPERNDSVLDHARRLREDHRKPGGIYGLQDRTVYTRRPHRF